jgi:thymidylate synthase (FAD)
LEDGRKIRCTQDHRFLFEDGWKTLETATGLTLNNGTAAYKAGLPKLVTNGRVVSAPLYRDKEWLREQYLRPEADDASIAEMLEVSAAVIRKWRKIHGLTGIKSGAHPAWNKGLRYKAGPRVLTDVHLEAIRAARSGPGSNFWKGGVSTRRGNIGRWTTEHARLVFEKNGFRCRACGKTGGRLHAHHIIPVWADIGKARNLDNLTALCAACHRDIHRRNAELDFAAKLEGKPAVVRYRKVSRPRPPAQRLMPVWMRISHIKYLGVRATYDLTVEGPYHNYVANGIVTHNSYNEISARYTEVHDEFYIPEEFRAQDTVNRQGSVEGRLDQEKLSAEYSAAIEASYAAYSALLKAGVAREMARGVLPVSQYTQFYWTVNARSLLNFLDLRLDKHAQLEIRRYAEAIAGVFKEKMPWTWEAHRRLNAE